MPMVRQSSSTSFHSSQEGNLSAAAAAPGSTNSHSHSNSHNHNPTPYISIMKHNLNFFMTRLLFMEEDKADSLQARRRRAGNNSSGNLAFNDSRALSDSQQLFEDDDNEDRGPLEGVIVFQDNARILPNTRAKSMPPVPFPPAAPESPQPVEGKHGITFMTPRHKRLESLPEALPLDELSVGDDDEDDEEEEEKEEDEELQMEASQELLPPPEDMIMTEDDHHHHDGGGDGTKEDSKLPPLVTATITTTTTVTTTPKKQQSPKRKSSLKTPTPFVPPDQRVFPKNQPRRLRNSKSDVQRSQSSQEVKAERQNKPKQGDKEKYDSDSDLMAKGNSYH